MPAKCSDTQPLDKYEKQLPYVEENQNSGNVKQ